MTVVQTIMPGLLLAGVMTVNATAADIRIEQIAPDSSVLVVSMPDMQPIAKRLQASPLKKIIDNEDYVDLEEFIDSQPDGAKEDIVRALAEDGDLIEAISKIGMGMSLYVVTDPETDLAVPGAIGYVDLGDHAEKLSEYIDDAFAENLKEDAELVEVAGKECIFVSGADSEDEPQGGMPMGPDLSALDGMDFYAYMDKEKGVFLFSSSTDGMRRAFEVMDGEEVSDTLENSDDWKGISGMIGEGLPSVVLLTSHMGDFVSIFDSSGMIGFMGSTIVAMTGKINAVGISLEPGQDSVLLQANAGAYMPEGKSGLMELISRNSDRAPIPAFLNTEVYGLSRYNINFGGVVDWIKNIIRSNPFLQAQGMQAFQQFEPTLTALMESLGDEVDEMKSISRPITAESLLTIMAFRSKDTQKFNDTFGTLAADMGMEQGDFQGHTIYTMDLGDAMMIPGMGMGSAEIAVAMSGGHIFMGDRNGVEEALRNVGARGELDVSTNLKAAMDALPNRPLSMWACEDTFKLMADSLEIEQLQLEQSLKELAEDDPELAEEIREEMKEEQALQNSLITELAEILGGVCWSTWSTDDGMRMQASVLELSTSDDDS